MLEPPPHCSLVSEVMCAQMLDGKISHFHDSPTLCLSSLGYTRGPENKWERFSGEAPDHPIEVSVFQPQRTFQVKYSIIR